MKLSCNKLFNLKDLTELELDSFYVNKEICLIVLNEHGSESDQFYILYNHTIISNIRKILIDNGYERNQFYFLLS